MYRMTGFWMMVAGLAVALVAGLAVLFARAKSGAERAGKATAAFFAALLGFSIMAGAAEQLPQPSCYAPLPPPVKPKETTAVERTKLALDELKKLYDSKAITEELYNLRKAALEEELAALNAPDMKDLVKSDEWKQLEKLWKNVEAVEKDSLKEGHNREAVYKASEGLLKPIREHKGLLDTMKEKKLLVENEYTLLFSILGTKLDGISSTNCGHTCYDRMMPEYGKDASARIELLRVSIENLNKFYAEKAVDEKVYTERKKQLENAIKAQEKIARPTGRAALILAALSGVKPAPEPKKEEPKGGEEQPKS